jgi:hypothetical protein
VALIGRSVRARRLLVAPLGEIALVLCGSIGITPRPGRTRERAVESRLSEVRLQRDVGDGAVAEHLATRVARACRGTPERVGRRGGEPVARAAEPRRREAGTL